MLPRVILHNEVSLDGRFDWITPDLGRFYQLASRWDEDATLAGSETFLAAYDREDAPEGDTTPPKRDPDDPRPLLVIPDSRGRLRIWQQLRKEPYWRDAVALCSESTPQEYMDYLKGLAVEHIVAGDDHVDLRTALEELNARYGVKVVRVDSGGTLNGALLRAGLVDEVSVLIEPRLVGGTALKSIFHAPDLTSPDVVIELELTYFERLSDGVVWLRYDVVK
jgi:2,5-diamino-6-(ribosylamino)-4(3H)-pyrimidinone 5'-phosphate reductase